MDASELKIARLEEAHDNFRRELAEMKIAMQRTSSEVHESKLAFVEFSTKIDTIHKMLENNKKNTNDWVRWIPGVLFGSVAMVIALIGKVGI